MADLKDSLKEMLLLREHLRKSVEMSEDVKNGYSTPEEERQEPSYILYDSIIESVIDILQSETVYKSFETLAKETSPETAKALIELLSVCMANSAHHAIVLYDNMLKSELDKQFDRYGDTLNNCIATVNAHDGVLKVLRKSISDLKSEIEEVKDN